MDVPLKAGDIEIHHCLTLHGSGPNRCGLPRRTIVFSYRAADAYQLADTVFADTGTLVCGERRMDVRCDSGTVRLPRRRRDGTNGYYGSAYHQVGEAARD